jgi:hypothetical protein
MVLIIHHTAKQEKKVFSLIGVSFAIMSTLVLSVDYFLQVSVIQPSLLTGETNGISILSQFNPHGVFIVLEEIGFIFMIISFLALAPVFSNKNSLERAIKWTAIVGFCLTTLSFLIISLMHGVFREYRFEVAVISIAWIELIILAFLFTKFFRKSLLSSQQNTIIE